MVQLGRYLESDDGQRLLKLAQECDAQYEDLVVTMEEVQEHLEDMIPNLPVSFVDHISSDDG